MSSKSTLGGRQRQRQRRSSHKCCFRCGSADHLGWQYPQKSATGSHDPDMSGETVLPCTEREGKFLAHRVQPSEATAGTVDGSKSPSRAVKDSDCDCLT